MAAANDAIVVTCTNNSDYAVICSFFEQFGDKSGLLFPSFQDLQQMLENVEEVSYPLIELHVKLMRKLKKSVSFDRWERAAAKYAHTYSDQDGWEIERFGYKKINLGVKLRLLKNLLEAQFDGNVKFKNEINKVTSDELRLQPLGKDVQGRRYWHLLDDDCNLRVYREDLDEETWDLVSSDRESMLKLIEQLSAGKELTEEEETSPASSEESSAHGQEEFVKVESEDKVQQSTDGPSETKRLKVEPTEAPIVSDPKLEAVVSEAIESPVLLVKGEGNGADCETGNPGEDKSEGSCESHGLTSKQDKADEKSSAECESDRLQSCEGASESKVVVETNLELSNSVPDSACQPQTSSPDPPDRKETPPLLHDSESSGKMNSVLEPPISEDNMRTVVNLPVEEATESIPNTSLLSKEDVPTPVNEILAQDCRTDEVDSSKKPKVIEEESLISNPPDEVANKEISIDKPSTELDGYPNQPECTDKLILPMSDNREGSSVVSSDISEHVEPAVPRSIPDFELSDIHNQELPKPDIACLSSEPVISEVKLDPLPPKSPTESVDPGDVDNTIPKDQSRSSAESVADIINTVSSPLPVDIPAEVEETKATVDPIPASVSEVIPSVPSTEEKASGIEESHSEQTTESQVKNNPESLDTNLPKIEEIPEVLPETRSERTSPTPRESPVEITEANDKLSDERSVSDVESTSTSNDDPRTNDDAKTVPETGAISKMMTVNEPRLEPDPTSAIKHSDLSSPTPVDEAVTLNSTNEPLVDIPLVAASTVPFELSDPSSLRESIVLCQSDTAVEADSRQMIIEETCSSQSSVEQESICRSDPTPVELVEPVVVDERTPTPDTKDLPVSQSDAPTEIPCGSPELPISDEPIKVDATEETCADPEPALTVGNSDVENFTNKVDVKIVETEGKVVTLPEKMEEEPTEVAGETIPTQPKMVETTAKVEENPTPSELADTGKPSDENEVEKEIPAVKEIQIQEESVTEVKEEPSQLGSPDIEKSTDETAVDHEIPAVKGKFDHLQDESVARTEENPILPEQLSGEKPSDEVRVHQEVKQELNYIQEELEAEVEERPTSSQLVIVEKSDCDSKADEEIPEVRSELEQVPTELIPEISHKVEAVKLEVDEEKVETLDTPENTKLTKEEPAEMAGETIPTHPNTAQEAEAAEMEKKPVPPDLQVPEKFVVETKIDEIVTVKIELDHVPQESAIKVEENPELPVSDKSIEEANVDKDIPVDKIDPVQEENIPVSHKNDQVKLEIEEEKVAALPENFESEKGEPAEIISQSIVEQSQVAEEKAELQLHPVQSDLVGIGKFSAETEVDAETPVVKFDADHVQQESTIKVEETQNPSQLPSNENSTNEMKTEEETPAVNKDHVEGGVVPEVPQMKEQFKLKAVEEPETNDGIPAIVPNKEVSVPDVLEKIEPVQTTSEQNDIGAVPSLSTAATDISEDRTKESLPQVCDSIKENLDDNAPLREPEENGVDQMSTTQPSSKTPAVILKEEVFNPSTSPIKMQDNFEVRHVSEFIPSIKTDDVTPLEIKEVVKMKETEPSVTNSGIEKVSEVNVKLIEANEKVEALPENVESKNAEAVETSSVQPAEPPTEVEEKPTPSPLLESVKATDLTKLTFDFDASAPAMIVLPPRSKAAEAAAKRRGRKRGRQLGDDATDSGKENDSIQRQPLVLRQSSRIAKLREKEDEERRKQEADRLQRLKEEHERREKRRAARDERMKKLEEKQQRRQQKTTREDVTYLDDESDDESSSSEDQSSKKKKKKDRRKHKKKKNDQPWDSTESSEKSSESEDDGLEDLQVEEENEELVFKSDHEFSPESDLDGEPEAVQPTKHARTARAGTVPKKRSRSKKVKVEEVEEVEEEELPVSDEEDDEEEEEKEANCSKCGQSDHPEWILLCDRCDSGWHANCVKPPLMVIPEGEWFCPPCDHVTLLERLQERLEAYEFLLKEKEAEHARKKEQELEAKLAREEAEKQAMKEMEEEAREEDDDDEGNSNAGDLLGADGEDVEEEESSDESGEEEEEDDAEDSQAESDENLNKRRQRKAAQQANYSFKDFDDMIKSALRDDGEEEEEEGGKGKGKGPRSGVDDKSDVEDDKARSPPGVRPSGIGNKRISTSDDDSDIMPQVIRKKKARKLNDLSATSNEDDSDEDFQGSSAEGSDSEDDDEEASDSGDSFVVDDDSDDDDVVHVSAKRKARAASPTIRRSTRSARKRNLRMDSSDTSEDESEFEVATKRKRGNESWDSSGESSSDASWGRSKKRKSTPKGRAKPTPPPPKPKPKPPPRKSPANRGRGRGGRANKAESDDEPFRSNVSVKKIKEARPVAQEDEDSDHAQRRTTRGRQISYKELISSGESQDEGGSTVKKMGTLFAADRNKSTAGSAARGGASRRGRGGATTPGSTGRGSHSDRGDNTPVPVSVISSRVTAALNQDDESRFSGSTDTLEFSTAAAAAAAAASVYTTGDESHTSNDVLPPNIDPELATLPIILPQEDVVASPLAKEDLPSSIPTSVLSQDLQVSRLIQQRPADVLPSGLPPGLPPDLQINRLINSQTVSSSSSNSPARQSPGILPQPRLVRDVLDSQTPPPAVQLSPAVATQPSVIASSVDLPLYSHGGVIKQTRHSLPPTPPLYSGPHTIKAADLIPSVTPPSVIRPYPTTATSSSLSSNIVVTNPGNPLSIQGLLGTGHGSPGPASAVPPPSHPASHIRPYGNTSHMIGHGPFLNHTPYGNPYSAVPPSRSSQYMGTPVTPTPRPAYSPMYPSAHLPPHGLPLHSPYQHHGPPLRPTSSYQHAGFPQAFAAAAAAAASAEEERRIYRVAQASREAGADNFDPATTAAGLLVKGAVDDPVPASAVPPESEFGGLVSYFSSQQEDFEES